MMRQCLRLWSQLAPKHRVAAMILTLGNIVASIIEVVGLTLFGTVLLHLTQAGTPTVVLGWSGVTGTTGPAGLRAAVVVCGIVYVGKNALMLGLAWLEAQLAFGVQADVSARTLATMLRQDYEQATRVTQSAKLNLLNGDMHALAFQVLLPALTALAEGMLLFALMVFLVFTQPHFVGGLLVTLCAIAGALVVASRRMVLRLGRARHRSEDDKMQLLSGIFGHLREMYVYSAGPCAVTHFQGMLARIAAANRGFQMLQTSPRFVLEVALVGAVLGVVFWQANAGADRALVVSIGIFGVAGFRLLLGINRIIACAQAMRFAAPIIDKITQALAGPAALPEDSHPMDGVSPGWGCLRLVGVSYGYDPGKPVLRQVDFELRRGSMIAIRGRSGAGKSTLLEILAGLRTPTEGWLERDGARIASKHELIGRVAYAGQQPAVFPDTIRANVAFGVPPEDIDDKTVWHALARANLDELVKTLPGQLDHQLGLAQTLSGGQVQRLALARALYKDCEYLLLDEPTAALDPETEMQLLATLKDVARTKGVLIVSHRSAPFEAADSVLQLSGGHLAVDSTKASRPQLHSGVGTLP